MLVRYHPEGATNATEWDFEPKRVRQSAAEMIERRYGDTYSKFVEAIQAGNARARRILLWHLMSATHPTLRLEDVPDFYVGEVTVDYSLADLQILRQEVMESSMDDTEREQMVRRLDLELATRLGKGDMPLEASDMGKAPLPDGGSSYLDSSPTTSVSDHGNPLN